VEGFRDGLAGDSPNVPEKESPHRLRRSAAGSTARKEQRPQRGRRNDYRKGSPRTRAATGRRAAPAIDGPGERRDGQEKSRRRSSRAPARRRKLSQTRPGGSGEEPWQRGPPELRNRPTSCGGRIRLQDFPSRAGGRRLNGSRGRGIIRTQKEQVLCQKTGCQGTPAPLWFRQLHWPPGSMEKQKGRGRSVIPGRDGKPAAPGEGRPAAAGVATSTGDATQVVSARGRRDASLGCSWRTAGRSRRIGDGVPFVGPAGGVARSGLEGRGFRRGTCYVTTW